MFYEFNDMLSYNALLNFIIGERGVGKTYGSKKFAVNRFKKYGEEFVYLRRYKTELKEAVGTKDKPKFFNQIKDEFPNDDLTNDSNTFFCNKKICGYALPLSTANILKSSSYDKVKTIIFDEFIIDKGAYRYLSNEVEQLLDIIETVSRLRDVRVIFLGNAISSTNPYFLYFDLSLPYQKTFKTFKGGLILVNYIRNLKYREVKKKTRFGQLIEGTPYGKYAIDNEFLRDSKTFIRKKTDTCKFYFKIMLDDKIYGIWTNPKSKLMYISDDYDSKCPIILSLTPDDHTEDTILLRSRESVYYQALIKSFRLSMLRFENQRIKNIFMPIISKHLTY